MKPDQLEHPISTLFLSESEMAFGDTLVSDDDGKYKGSLMLTLKEGYALEDFVSYNSKFGTALEYFLSPPFILSYKSSLTSITYKYDSSTVQVSFGDER